MSKSIAVPAWVMDYDERDLIDGFALSGHRIPKVISGAGNVLWIVINNKE